MDDDQTIRIVTEISKVGEGVKAMHKRMDDHENRTTKHLDKISETVYGNGQPGLTTTVQVLETKHNNLLNRLKFWGGIGGTVLTAAILAFFGLA